MTKSHPTPPTAALVAIDVAKLRNEVLIEVPDARRRRRMMVTNTRAEHDRLCKGLAIAANPDAPSGRGWLPAGRQAP